MVVREKTYFPFDLIHIDEQDHELFDKVRYTVGERIDSAWKSCSKEVYSVSRSPIHRDLHVT